MSASKPRGRLTTELVERAQRGDHEAFDALASAAYHRLYAIARRILRDGYAAEDAVQDALVNAWRDVRGLRDPAAFDAWLHRLLVNACHDQIRRSRRRPVEVPNLAMTVQSRVTISPSSPTATSWSAHSSNSPSSTEPCSS